MTSGVDSDGELTELSTGGVSSIDSRVLFLFTFSAACGHFLLRSMLVSNVVRLDTISKMLSSILFISH